MFFYESINQKTAVVIINMQKKYRSSNSKFLSLFERFTVVPHSIKGLFHVGTLRSFAQYVVENILIRKRPMKVVVTMTCLQ